MRVDTQFGSIHVLTDADIFHFGCDDAGTGTCHLTDGLSVGASVGYPCFTDAFDALAWVGLDGRVGIGSSCIIDIDGGVGYQYLLPIDNLDGRGEIHFLHPDLDERINRTVHIYFFALCVCFFFFHNHSFKNAVSGDEADAIIPVAIPPNPAS